MAILEQNPHRAFTAHELECMLREGILGEDEPLELIEGELIIMSPQGPDHAALTEHIRELFQGLFERSYHFRCHSPLAATELSQPEPDLAVVRGRPAQYRARHPRGSDVVLVLEIAATSRPIDRYKARIYGEAGVPVYWLLDLASRRLEVRTEPQPDGEYASVRLLNESESVVVPTTTHEIVIAELLG